MARPSTGKYEYSVYLGKSVPYAIAQVHKIANQEGKSDKKRLWKVPKGAFVFQYGNEFVLCDSPGYVKLLNRRVTSFIMKGDPNWGKCWHCKEYGPPESMDFRDGIPIWHKECRLKYLRERRKGMARPTDGRCKRGHVRERREGAKYPYCKTCYNDWQRETRRKAAEIAGKSKAKKKRAASTGPI